MARKDTKNIGNSPFVVGIIIGCTIYAAYILYYKKIPLGVVSVGKVEVQYLTN